MSSQARLLAGLSLIFALLAGWALHVRSTRRALRVATAHTTLRAAMAQDDVAGYRCVLACAEVLGIAGARDLLADAQAAYASAILAVEHQERARLEPARAHVARLVQRDALSAGPAEARDAVAAAGLLLLWADGDVAAGLRAAEQQQQGDASLVFARLEALRLLVAARSPAPQQAVAAQALASSVRDEVRPLSYLGLWALAQDNSAQAQQYFERALARSPEHAAARLGAAMVATYRPHPDKKVLWAVRREAGALLARDSGKLSPAVQALALLVQAQAEELEGDLPAAQRDRAAAMQLDPGNLLIEASRTSGGRP